MELLIDVSSGLGLKSQMSIMKLARLEATIWLLKWHEQLRGQIPLYLSNFSDSSDGARV
jgi:hypothetical protein